MPKCKECNDTGVIETGNNDLPCHCSEGDSVLFNVAGEGQVTGAEIKRRNRSPQIPIRLCDRREFGHVFCWYERPGCWHSTSGQSVMVVPPQVSSESWLVIVPNNDSVEEIAGHEAEKRAFASAEVYTRQLSSVV